jgi:hypothetical protein
MAKFNEKEVKEINSVILDIQKAIDKMKSPNCKIGARDKVTAVALLKANSIPTSNAVFFKCRREHSDAIVSHFVVNKEMKKSRFSMNRQQNIYIVKGEEESVKG